VTNLNADLLDGLHASAFQQHMQSVRVVAKSGGDYTTITGALNGITDASAANPYLIYVAPGVYTEQVTMKPYVDIQGAGELLTKITAAASMNASSGTVIGAGNAGLSFLTVESIGSPSLTYATAIYNTASVRLTHVTAIASGSPNSTGVENYAYLNTPNSSIDITMTDVTASASVDGPARAFGVYNYTYGTGPGNMMKVTMTNLNASASMAGFTMGVYNRIQNGKMEVTMSYVNATASGGAFGGDIYGVYNESSSPTMTVVSAIVTGGNHANHAYGVYNKTSTAAMTDVTATVSGDTNNYGIYNSLSSPTMSDVTAIASGGTNNYGVWNDSSSVTILDSVISASSGTSDGIHNAGAGAGPFTVMINKSRVVGGSSTIYTEVATYTTKVGASQLVGIGGQGFGTYKCVFTYNGNFDPLGAATCQ